MLRDDVRRLAELHRGLVFPFGGDNLRATLALGLGFLCHCALHIVGKYNVLDFDCRYLRTPRLRVPVDDVLDLLVDARGVRKKLIEAESSDHIAHGSLTDLIDRIVDVLNHDHSSFRIGNMIVSDRRDVDRDVILGDDFLRGDLHRDGAQRHAHHLLDGNEDEREPRPAHALEFSEKKYYAALVLPKHAQRADEIEDYRNADNVGPVHGVSIWFEESQLEIRRKSPPGMAKSARATGPKSSIRLSLSSIRPSIGAENPIPE